MENEEWGKDIIFPACSSFLLFPSFIYSLRAQMMEIFRLYLLCFSIFNIERQKDDGYCYSDGSQDCHDEKGRRMDKNILIDHLHFINWNSIP